MRRNRLLHASWLHTMQGFEQTRTCKPFVNMQQSATGLAGRLCPAYMWQLEQRLQPTHQQQAPASGACPQHNGPPTQGSTTLCCSASQRKTHNSMPPSADADMRVMLVSWPQCSSGVSCLQPQRIHGRSTVVQPTYYHAAPVVLPLLA